MFKTPDELEAAFKQDALQEAVNRNQARLSEMKKTPYQDRPLTQRMPTDDATLAEVDAQFKALAKRDEDPWVKSYEREQIIPELIQGGAQALDFISGTVTGIPSVALDLTAVVRDLGTDEQARALYARKEAYNNAVADGSLKDRIAILDAAEAELAANTELSRDERITQLAKIANVRKLLMPLSEEEQAVLDRPVMGMTSETTNEERIRSTEGLRAAAKAIDDWQDDVFGDNVNQQASSRLWGDVKGDWQQENAQALRDQGWEKIQRGNVLEGASDWVEGAWDSAGRIGESISDNPLAAKDAAVDALVEIAAFMKGKFLGKAAGVSDSVSGANQAMRDGIEEFEKENGRTPDNEELARITLSAAGYGLTDYLSLRVGVKALDKLRPEGKRGTPDTDVDVPVETGLRADRDLIPADVAARNTAVGKAKQLVQDTATRAGRTANAVLAEGATGAVQGLLEETGLKDNYDLEKVDTGNVVANAVMEALGVGTLSAARNTLGTANNIAGKVTDAVGDAISKLPKLPKRGSGTSEDTNTLLADSNNATPETKQTRNTNATNAIKTGDLSTVTDENNPDFDTLTALRTIAARNKTEGVTDAEKEENLMMGMAHLDSLVGKSFQISQKIATLAEQGAAEDSPEIQKLNKEKVLAEQRVTEAYGFMEQLAAQVNTPEQVETTRAQITEATEKTSESIQAGDKAIVMVQQRPDTFTAEQAKELAQSEGLEDSQRKFFAQVAVTQEAIENFKSTDQVNQDVLVGSPGFRGVAQYRQTLPALLKQGKTESAAALVASLTKFAEQKIQRAQDFGTYFDVLTNPESTQADKDAAKAAFDAKGYMVEYGKYAGTPAFVNARSQASAQMIEAQRVEANLLQAVMDESMAMLGDGVRSGKISLNTAKTVGETLNTSAAVKPVVRSAPPRTNPTTRTINRPVTPTVGGREGVPTADVSELDADDQMMANEDTSTVAATTAPTTETSNEALNEKDQQLLQRIDAALSSEVRIANVAKKRGITVEKARAGLEAKRAELLRNDVNQDARATDRATDADQPSPINTIENTGNEQEILPWETEEEYAERIRTTSATPANTVTSVAPEDAAVTPVNAAAEGTTTNASTQYNDQRANQITALLQDIEAKDAAFSAADNDSTDLATLDALDAEYADALSTNTAQAVEIARSIVEKGYRNPYVVELAQSIVNKWDNAPVDPLTQTADRDELGTVEELNELVNSIAQDEQGTVDMFETFVEQGAATQSLDPVEDTVKPEAATSDPTVDDQTETTPTTENTRKDLPSILDADVEVASEDSAYTFAAKLIALTKSKFKKYLTIRKKSGENSGNLQLIDFHSFFNDMLPDDHPAQTIYALHNELAEVFDRLVESTQDDPFFDILRDENGVISEQVKAAFTIAAVNWLTTKGQSTLFNDDSAINSLLKRDPEEHIPNALRQAMQGVGSYPDTIAESLGREIAGLLSIKFNSEAYSNLQPLFEMSMGGLLLDMLADRQYVTIDTKDAFEFITKYPHKKGTFGANKRKLLEAFSTTGSIQPTKFPAGLKGKEPVEMTANELKASGIISEKLVFVRLTDASLVKDENGTPGKKTVAHPRIQALKSGNEAPAQGTDTKRNFVQDTFGADKTGSGVEFAPVQDVVQKMRRTDQNIPQKAKDAIAKAQARGNTLKSDMAETLLNVLPERLTLKIFGYDEADRVHTHVENMSSLDGNQEAAERSLRNYRDLLNSGAADKPFYFRYFVSKQGRFFIDSNDFNPQQDKAHRWLYTNEDFQYEVTRRKNGKGRYTKSEKDFRIALAQAFGIKIDKQTNRTSLKQLEKVLADNPQIATAAEMLNNPAADQATLETAVAAAMEVSGLGYNTHTLAGLMEYGKYLKDEPFTSSLLVEVDGITNGVAIGMLQFAGWGATKLAKATLAKFGVFFDGTTSFGEWKERKIGTDDAYEQMAKEWSHYLTDTGMTALIEAAIFELEQYNDKGYKQKDIDRLNAAMPMFKHLRNFLGEIKVEKNANGETYLMVNGVDKNGNDKDVGRGFAKYPTMYKIYGSGVDAIAEGVGEAVMDKIRETIEKIHASKKTPEQKASDLEKLHKQVAGMLGLNEADAHRVLPWTTRDPMSPGGNARIFDVNKALKFEFTKTQYRSTGEVGRDGREKTYKFNIANHISQLTVDTYGLALNKAMANVYGAFDHNRSEYIAGMNIVNEMFVEARDVLISKRIAELTDKDHPDYDPNFDESTDLPTKDLQEIDRKLKPLMPTARQPYQDKDERVGFSLFLGKGTRQRGDNPAAHDIQLPKNMRSDNVISADGKPHKGLVKSLTIQVRGYDKEMGVRAPILNIHNMDSSPALEALDQFNLLAVHDGFVVRPSDAGKVANTLNRRFYLDAMRHSMFKEAGQVMQRARKAYLKILEENGIDENNAEFTPLNADGQPMDLKGQRESRLSQVFEVADSVEKERMKVVNKITGMIQYNYEGGTFEPTGVAISDDWAEVGKATVEEIKEEIQEEREARSEWGAVGKHGKFHKQFPPSYIIEKAFADKDELSASEILDAVEKQLSLAERKENKAMYVLLPFLRKLVEGTGVTVKIIRPDTAVDREVLEEVKGFGSVHGMYVRRNDQILLSSSAFVMHGMNPSTIVHELLHAVTTGLLRGKVPLNPQQQKAREQLTKLFLYTRSKLKEAGYLNDPYSIASFAMEDVDEFISWGLTDARIQNILKGVILDKSYPGELKTVFAAFVDAIRQLLGLPNDNPEVSDALTQLIGYATDLMDGDIALPPADPDNTKSLAQRAPITYSPEELFRSINAADHLPISKEEEDRLAELVRSVEAVIPGDELDALNQDINDATDLYIHASVNDRTPFVSSLLGMGLSNAQLYVAEQIEAATREGLRTNPRAYKELRVLFKRAKDQLPLSVFAADPAMDLSKPENRRDRKDAERKRAALFTLTASKATDTRSETSATGRTQAIESDYLARFLAMSQVDPKLRTALEQLTPDRRVERVTTNLSEQLDWFLNKVMDLINVVVGIRGRDSKTSADALMRELADIRVHHQSTLMQKATDVGGALENGANSLARAVGKAIVATANTNALKNSNFRIVQGAATAVRATVQGRVGEHIRGLEEFTQKYRTGKMGLIEAAFNEMKGMAKDTVGYFELLRKSKNRIDHARKQIESNTSKAVLDAFGRELEKEELDALTQVLIEGDLQSLIRDNAYSLNDLAEMLSNSTTLHTEINKHRRQLNMRMRQDARELGHFIVTGKASEHQLWNAHNIAYQHGRDIKVSKKEAEAALPSVERLASLWAIEYMSSAQKQRVVNLIREEAGREDGMNGVEFVLNMHRALIDKSKSDLFNDKPGLMIKGYTKDTVDPHITVQITHDPNDPDLIRRGYKVPEGFEKLQRDETDPFQAEPTLMVSQGDALKPYVTGIMSFSGKQAKGSHAERLTKLQVARIHQAKMKKLKANPTVETDPALNTRSHLVPVITDSGKTVDYRYIMRKEHRNELLRRDNDVSKVLGVYAGSIVDKKETVNINNEAIAMLKSDFDQYGSNYGQYIAISSESTDPELKSQWHMLPDETKEAVRKHFGGETLYVRRDMLPMVMGYRKMGTLTSLWDVPEEDRGFIRQQLIDALESSWVLGPAALARLRKGSDIWEEMVRSTKDIIVIRTGIVLLGNVISNMSVLWVGGMSFKNMAKYQQEGYAGVKAYLDNTRELSILKQQLMGSPSLARTKQKAMEQRIIELQDALARNPVRELAESGALTTIVEDLDDAPDEFSYKTRLMEWVDEKTSFIPQPFKTAAEVATVGRNTTLYKILNHGTQVSDFVARYAMYKHMTEHAETKVSKRDAINEVMEMFIMYDVPTDKRIQWANDKGLLWFTKYTMRVQKVLYRMAHNNPGRFMSLMMLNGVFDFYNIIESIATPAVIANKFMFPVSAFTEAPSDIITFDLASQLM